MKQIERPSAVEVGKRVKLPLYIKGRWLEVTAIGKSHFLAVNPEGTELMYSFRSDWLEADLPLPETPTVKAKVEEAHD